MELLEGLQEDAAALGYIHDPVFYFGETDGEYIVGAVFQVVSPTMSEAMLSGLSSFKQLLEERLPEEDPYDGLTFYSIHCDYDDATEKETSEAADTDQ